MNLELQLVAVAYFSTEKVYKVIKKCRKSTFID